jgi:hypothetical protein
VVEPLPGILPTTAGAAQNALVIFDLTIVVVGIDG